MHSSFASSAPDPVCANVAKKKHVSIRAGADDYDDDVDDNFQIHFKSLNFTLYTRDLISQVRHKQLKVCYN